MREQAIQTAIIKYLKSLGIYTVKVMAATRAGVPDIIACYTGKFIAIEVKQPNNRPSELQKYNLQQILNAKGYACIATSVEDVKNFLKEIRNEN